MIGHTYRSIEREARRLVSEVFNTAARKITDEHRDNGWASSNDPHYPYIHLDHDRFDEAMDMAVKSVKVGTDGLKFLDVGAGVGEKVMIMMHQVDLAHGIELREEYVEESKRLFELFGVKRDVHPIFKIDALKFKGYGRYHIIYFYRPMKDEKMQQELEDRIISQAKKGTVIVGVLNQSLEKREELIQLGHSPVFIRK